MCVLKHGQAANLPFPPFSLLFVPLSRPPFSDFMGRPPWATPSQLVFLEGFIPQLDAEKDGNTLKAFYASVAQEFIKQWVSPIPADVDTDAITDPVELKRLSDARRARVSFTHPLTRSALTSYFSSKSKTGLKRPDANPQTFPLSQSPLSTLLAKAPGSPPPYSSIKRTQLDTFKRVHRCVKRLRTYGAVATNKKSSTP